MHKRVVQKIVVDKWNERVWWMLSNTAMVLTLVLMCVVDVLTHTNQFNALCGCFVMKLVMVFCLHVVVDE